jgi:hypothetical protein
MQWRLYVCVLSLIEVHAHSRSWTNDHIVMGNIYKAQNPITANDH